jgi:hypothetical protein
MRDLRFLFKYPNVVGYSNVLLPKIVKGKETDVLAIRVYVSKKVPVKELRAQDIIPHEIDGVPTDVVEIGKIEAFKTSKQRPVTLGLSVSHWNVTSGSLGMLYEYQGNLVAGSNAHVLVDNPSKKPEEVSEKRIVQPGTYFGGQNPDNIVGEYLWHERVRSIDESCKIAKGVTNLLNSIARALRRRSRFIFLSYPVNYIDFAVYKPTVEHQRDFYDQCTSKDWAFIGHLFAGSDQSGIVCKVKYILDKKFKPCWNYTTEILAKDKVHGCSFWCHYDTTVSDPSGNVIVSYGDFEAYFEDVIILYNDGTIKGGWSGSGFFKVT